uniref:Uncharacterized protein n=1 Tax=viral metagenome TaxID=1070528 RepID=A0A6C0ACC6_9ZZZZ
MDNKYQIALAVLVLVVIYFLYRTFFNKQSTQTSESMVNNVNIDSQSHNSDSNQQTGYFETGSKLHGDSNHKLDQASNHETNHQTNTSNKLMIPENDINDGGNLEKTTTHQDMSMSFNAYINPKDKLYFMNGDFAHAGVNPKITNQDNSLEQENSQENLEDPLKNYKSIVGTR